MLFDSRQHLMPREQIAGAARRQLFMPFLILLGDRRLGFFSHSGRCCAGGILHISTNASDLKQASPDDRAGLIPLSSRFSWRTQFGKLNLREWVWRSVQFASPRVCYHV